MSKRPWLLIGVRVTCFAGVALAQYPHKIAGPVMSKMFECTMIP